MSIVVATLLYKIASLFCGTAICWMGYRMFSEGIFGSAGDVDATFRDTRLVVKRGAPGTFFVMLGTAVLITALVKGLVFSGPEQAVGNPPPPADLAVDSRGMPIHAMGSSWLPVAPLDHPAKADLSVDQANAQALQFACAILQADPVLTKDLPRVETLLAMRNKILRANFDDETVGAFLKSSDPAARLTPAEQLAADKVRTWLAPK